MNLDRVTVIGTNDISASVAMRLKTLKEPPEIVGYDAEAAVADLARAQGAFDQVKRKPGRACQDADLVIIAEPLSDTSEVFAAIAPHLRPGCLVIDTARLKAPVLRWAEQYLPDDVLFVGGHIVPNPAVVGLGPQEGEGLDTASADLLKQALYCFITPPGVSSAAIDICTALVQALEGHVYFIDVTEHDGLQAGVVGLLDLLTVAVLRATVGSAGWQEMRKFAGDRFAVATQAADDIRDRHSDVFLNRENILRRLDILLRELVHLRGLLASDDPEALEAVLAEAAEARASWIRERKRGMWVEEGAFDTRDVPSTGEQLGRMVFGNLADRLRRGPGGSREG